MAPADASAELYTGGSVGPADEPAPTAPAPATPRVAPASASAPSSPSAAPAPVSHATGNAVDPHAGGEEPSAPLEPLAPSSGQAQANPKTGTPGASRAMTPGATVTTLTLGLGLLAAGLAGTAIARRRRDAANQYS
jgi:hypothetical protein